MQKPKLVAVDSNVLILLAEEDDLTIEAFDTIRLRIRPAQFVVPPVVVRELTHKVRYDPHLKRPAERALREMRPRWRCQALLLNAVQEVVADQAAKRLREAGLLPQEERNDASLLAQAAALGCALLITYDSHLRDIDFEKLTLLLGELDLAAPVLATPSEVVRKFYR